MKLSKTTVTMIQVITIVVLTPMLTFLGMVGIMISLALWKGGPLGTTLGAIIVTGLTISTVMVGCTYFVIKAINEAVAKFSGRR